ncbi:MAG: hypothetical protein JO131_09945, partial [Gammaproteobacteria bacterium]|nr:hypothetical protein [Gammaproteobacteria bacterium]
TYAEKKYPKEWVLKHLSVSILSKEESLIGEVYRECRQLSLTKKLPSSLLTDVINTYFNVTELSTMAKVSRLIFEKTKKSKHYEYWKNTYKWKKKLIELGCRKQPLTIALSTMHIQNPEHLYNVLKNQEEYACDYKEPWTFYILSGELKPIEYAISHYQLTDNTRTTYNESPFVLAIFSRNYQAVDLVLKKMAVNFYNLTTHNHTPLHIAAWSKSILQVEYIKYLIHQYNLTFTVDDKDKKGRNVFSYADKNWKIIRALSKSVKKIEVEKFVDEEGRPLFKRP